MVKLLDDGSLVPPAETKSTLGQKQSPVFVKPVRLSKIGPRHGKNFAGSGGLKPYRMPANGSKPVSLNFRTRKPLRAPVIKEK